MNIKFESEIFENGYLIDKYSKYAESNQTIEGIPYINFPFEVTLSNPKYKYISWVLIDHDANPVVNFSWIHWLVANYMVTNGEASVPQLLVDSALNYTGGTNSFAGPLTNIKGEQVVYNYGGPTPPDTAHVYTLYVYAHQHELNLSKRFFYNDLLNELEKQEQLIATAKFKARA